jgi:pimeloyl-ACP methyl ester carboxylesterase
MVILSWMYRRPIGFIVAGFTVVAGALMLAPPTTAATSRGTAPFEIDWGDCPPAPPAARDPRQRCGVLSVPLDYRAPSGRAITITISRIPTARAGAKRGVLVVNPGGPGEAGLDFPSRLIRALPQSVTDRYDLIGFDPRGVGHSTPVTCGLARDDTTMELVLPYPAGDGSIDRNITFARATAAQCAARSGELLPFITTANTARDLDRIRRALSESKLSYLGFSYGTYLGAVYATMFEETTDRVVLDSAVDPKLVWYDMWRTWNRAISDRFPDAARYAAGQNELLGFGSTVAEVTDSYLALTRRLDADPIALPALGIRLSGNVLREVTRGYLYSDSSIPALITIWAEAAGRSPVPDQPALTTALRRRLAVDNAIVPADNAIASLYAVACGDVTWSADVTTYAASTASDRVSWPLTAGMPSNVWPCAFWKYPAIEPPVAITNHGRRNILVLQNRRDPATSWDSGLGMRRALGQRAAFVGVDAGGHGTYGWGTCADPAAERFLGSGELPSHAVSCAKPEPGTVPAHSGLWEPTGRALSGWMSRYCRCCSPGGANRSCSLNAGVPPSCSPWSSAPLGYSLPS